MLLELTGLCMNLLVMKIWFFLNILDSSKFAASSFILLSMHITIPVFQAVFGRLLNFCPISEWNSLASPFMLKLNPSISFLWKQLYLLGNSSRLHCEITAHAQITLQTWEAAVMAAASRVLQKGIRPSLVVILEATGTGKSKLAIEIG